MAGYCRRIFRERSHIGFVLIVAYGFPTHVRATGTGFVIGVGRGGAVLSPSMPAFSLTPPASQQASLWTNWPLSPW